MAGSRSWDAVVVGAGILGCCTAYHLQGLGARHVLLLDRAKVGSGTTDAGAGFIAVTAGTYHWYWGETERVLEMYSIDFYQHLVEAGYDVGLRMDGNLFVAASERGWTSIVEPFQVSALRPPGAQALSPQSASAMAPCLDVREVVGGVYFPLGGQLEPRLAAEAIANEVRSRGGTIVEGEEVKSVTVRRGQVVGVETGRDQYRTKAVVIAAGYRSTDLLVAVHHDVPVVLAADMRAISSVALAPRGAPTIMVPDLRNSWLRMQGGSYTYGGEWGYRTLVGGGVASAAEGQNAGGRPDGAARRRLVAMRLGLARLIPDLRTVPLREWRQGVFHKTVDRKFLAGPVGEPEGMYVIAGCNEAGIMHGPGLGRLLAEQITGQETTSVPGDAYDPGRFGEKKHWSRQAILGSMPARWPEDGALSRWTGNSLGDSQ